MLLWVDYLVTPLRGVAMIAVAALWRISKEQSGSCWWRLSSTLLLVALDRRGLWARSFTGLDLLQPLGHDGVQLPIGLPNLTTND